MLHAKIQTVFLLALLLVAAMARPQAHALERNRSNVQSPAGAAAAAPAPEPRTLESLGYVLGAPAAVATQGIYAAVITWGQFAMLNIADPTHPRAIGYLTLPGMMHDVALDESYAYIAWGQCDRGCTGGLRIVDIRNPTAPVLVGAFQGSKVAQAVAVAGSYAYLVTGDAVLVFDISNPTAPKQRGVLQVYWGSDITLLRDYATSRLFALVPTDRDLHILDVSNPNAPVEASAPLRGWDRNAHIALFSPAGSTPNKIYAYVAIYQEGLRIFDVTDPAHTVEVAALPIPDTNAGVVVQGRYAYVSLNNFKTRVLDLAQPTAPLAVSTYDAFVWDIAGRYALARDPQGLQVVDISNPANLMQVSSFDTSVPYGAIAATDRYLFTPDENGLQILDAFDPVAPAIVGSFHLPAYGQSVTLAGHYALITDEYGSVAIIDIANPMAPEQVGSYAIGKQVSQIATTGAPGSGTAYAYVSWVYCDPASINGCEGGLRVLDISKPTAPVQVGAYTLPGAARAIVLAGKYAYVAVVMAGPNSINSLVVLDLSNPTQPTQIGATNVTGYAQALAVDGHYAYITAWEEGLRVIDVANPTAPIEVGSYKYAPHSGTHGVAAADGYVYITDQGDSRLMVLDVSNPVAPRNVATVALPGSGAGITAANGYLYVNTSWGGIAILRHGPANTGQVRDVRGMPVSGVRIATDSVPSAVSGVTGGYRLASLSAGTHTLTPGLPGYAFWPASRTVTAATGASGQNFTLLPLPVSAIITPDRAATLVVTDTQGLPTRFDLPAHAVAMTTTLQVTPIPETGRTGIAFAGHAFEVAALQNGAPLSSLKFATPMTVTISYSAADVWTVSNKGALVLQRWNGSAWGDAGATCTPPSTYYRDVKARVLRVAICQPGRYALFGATKQVMLPLVRT